MEKKLERRVTKRKVFDCFSIKRIKKLREYFHSNFFVVIDHVHMSSKKGREKEMKKNKLKTRRPVLSPTAKLDDLLIRTSRPPSRSSSRHTHTRRERERDRETIGF